MYGLRPLFAAIAFMALASAIPDRAVAQTPLQQLEQLSDQARAADEAHAEAAKICDRAAMQEHLQTLNRLAREARRVADAARAAGEFATIDPVSAARMAAIIATRARVAANRQPENCDERDASRKEYFAKVEETLTAMEAARLRGDCDEFRRLAEQAEYEISLERPIGYVEGEEAQALRQRLHEMEGRPCPPQQEGQTGQAPPAEDPASGGLQQQPATGTQGQPQFEPPPPAVDRALSLNFEHARAASRCDGPEMNRLLEELERLAREAEMEMHRWDGALTPDIWARKANEYYEIKKILDAARARQAAPCPRHRMQRIPQQQQEQQQQQQQQQQEQQRSENPLPNLLGPLKVLGGGSQQPRESGRQPTEERRSVSGTEQQQSDGNTQQANEPQRETRTRPARDTRRDRCDKPEGERPADCPNR